MVRLNPRVVFAFEKIFEHEDNHDLLISFINSVVSEEHTVASIEVLKPPHFKYEKGAVLDIKAKDLHGKTFDLIIDIRDEGDYDQSDLFNWAKFYADQRHVDQFSILVVIHIQNFTCVLNNKNIFRTFPFIRSNWINLPSMIMKIFAISFLVLKPIWIVGPLISQNLHL